jgi:hypothetical protein
MVHSANSASPRNLSTLSEEGFNSRRMLSVTEWCRLNNLSPDLGRRILAGLTKTPPPKVTQLSDRRIAIRADHNREWQDQLIRAEPKMSSRASA